MASITWGELAKKIESFTETEKNAKVVVFDTSWEEVFTDIECKNLPYAESEVDFDEDRKCFFW